MPALCSADGRGGLGSPSPFGAGATAGPTNFSDPFACHKHQGRKSWSISEACEACIALADPHSNNYGRANSFQALIKTGADGSNIKSDACDASGSACTAGPGSPVSARGGPPPPPPFWRALGTERGGVGGPLLSLAWLAWTLPCKLTLLGRL